MRDSAGKGGLIGWAAWAAWVSLALATAGCQRGPKTPEAAYLELEPAVAGANAANFYRLLDDDTRAAVESTLHDQRLMRTIISAKFPPAEAGKELARLAAAEEADPARYFARVNQERHSVEGFRRRLGSVSGPVKSKIVGPDEVYVARADGMPFKFHRNHNGSWGFSELSGEWSRERDRASHAVQTVRDNAALYQKADSP